MRRPVFRQALQVLTDQAHALRMWSIGSKPITCSFYEDRVGLLLVCHNTDMIKFHIQTHEFEF